MSFKLDQILRALDDILVELDSNERVAAMGEIIVSMGRLDEEPDDSFRDDLIDALDQQGLR